MEVINKLTVEQIIKDESLNNSKLVITPVRELENFNLVNPKVMLGFDDRYIVVDLEMLKKALSNCQF